ncbi:hypothetical protein KTAU_02390 [Thermogemmatispora aurantia]|uniref:Uncharacterized protein n=1 Tax=Thermogemmatispora aurantia TaxID=2045279 RepID=A0A5J4K4A9_9CHLR|nr:hypothetical protein KTAU_02390 [Thermogemmatispora aurantia]
MDLEAIVGGDEAFPNGIEILHLMAKNRQPIFPRSSGRAVRAIWECRLRLHAALLHCSLLGQAVFCLLDDRHMLELAGHLIVKRSNNQVASEFLQARKTLL